MDIVNRRSAAGGKCAGNTSDKNGYCEPRASCWGGVEGTVQRTTVTRTDTGRNSAPVTCILVYQWFYCGSFQYRTVQYKLLVVFFRNNHDVHEFTNTGQHQQQLSKWATTSIIVYKVKEHQNYFRNDDKINQQFRRVTNNIRLFAFLLLPSLHSG